MPQDPHDIDPQHREHADPHESLNPVPIAFLLLMAGLFLWGIYYLSAAHPDDDPALGDRRTPEALMAAPQQAADGGALFAANCAACHQATGAGIPQVFPPLAKSEWVDGSASVLAKIVLHGITGEINVAGNTYNGAMPAFADSLDDEQIAAILTHIRSSWDNTGDAVTADTVQAARAETSARGTPWNGGAELSKLE